MKQRGRKLVLVGLVAAVAALGGCKSQELGGSGVPTGGFHPTEGSGGASGGGATNGGGGAPSGGGGFGADSGTGTGVGGRFGAGSGGGLGTGSGGSGQCEGVGYQTSVVAPDFLIVMSRATELSSYLDQACSIPGCAKWSILESAVNSVVAANQDDNYGLMMFGAGGACDVPEYPDLDISPQSWMQIVDDTGLVSLGGTSPMTGTITSAVSYLQSLTDASPKYILLVTDGEATCTPGDVNGTMDDTSRAEGEISAAFYAGFPTLVLGVADPNNAQEIANLNTMANAGALPQVGADTAYYDAGSSAGIAALDQAISAMVRQAPACTFVAPSGGPPGASLSVSISHDDDITPVPYDPTGTSGWNYTDSTETVVSLSGAYCSQLGAVGQTTVELTWACGSRGLPVP